VAIIFTDETQWSRSPDPSGARACTAGQRDVAAAVLSYQPELHRMFDESALAGSGLALRVCSNFDAELLQFLSGILCLFRNMHF